MLGAGPPTPPTRRGIGATVRKRPVTSLALRARMASPIFGTAWEGARDMEGRQKKNREEISAIGAVIQVSGAPASPGPGPSRALGMGNREDKKAEMEGFPLATPDWARRRAAKASGGWRASVPRSTCRPSVLQCVKSMEKVKNAL